MILSLVAVPLIELFQKDTAVQMHQFITLYEQQLLDIERENEMEQIENEIQFTDQDKSMKGGEKALFEKIQEMTEKEIKYKLNNTKMNETGYDVEEIIVNGVCADGTWNEQDFSIEVYVHKRDVTSEATEKTGTDGIKKVEKKEGNRVKIEKVNIEKQKHQGESREEQSAEEQSREELSEKEQKDIGQELQNIKKICAEILETDEKYVEVKIAE